MAGTERGVQWWVRYVAVPVLTSGMGILLVTLLLKSNPPKPEPSSPPNPIPTAEAGAPSQGKPLAPETGDHPIPDPTPRPARIRSAAAVDGDQASPATSPQAKGELETSAQDRFALGLSFPVRRHSSCDGRGHLTAEPGPNLPVNIRNTTGHPLKLYWIGGDGIEHPAEDLTDKPVHFGSGADTPYLVTDESDHCIRIFHATQKYSHFTFKP